MIAYSNELMRYIMGYVTLKTEIWLNFYNNVLIYNNIVQNNYIKICNLVIDNIKTKSLSYRDIQDLEILLGFIYLMEDTLVSMETFLHLVVKYISVLIVNIKSIPRCLIGVIKVKIPKKSSLYSDAMLKCSDCKKLLLFKEELQFVPN